MNDKLKEVTQGSNVDYVYKASQASIGSSYTKDTIAGNPIMKDIYDMIRYYSQRGFKHVVLWNVLAEPHYTTVDLIENLLRSTGYTVTDHSHRNDRGDINMHKPQYTLVSWE